MKTEEYLDFFSPEQRPAYLIFMATGEYDQELADHVRTSVLAMDGLKTSLRTWATELERTGHKELAALLRQHAPSVFDQAELQPWHHPDWPGTVQLDQLRETIQLIHQTVKAVPLSHL